MTQALTRGTQQPFESYLQDINGTSLLDATEEAELAWRVREDGDCEARDHLARANLRLVVSLAKHFAGRGLPMEDLIAEGNLGLLRSVESFDPSMGIRFSTYACYWIKQSMRRAIVNTGGTVRLPAYIADLVTKWRRATVALQEYLGRSPSEEEVAERLGLSARRLNIIRKAIRIQGATYSHDEDATSGLPSLPAGGDRPDARLGGEEEMRQVLGLLGQLEEREATVLRLRFGLGGTEPLTLKAVGERLGLTRERVRQIETVALRNLRERIEPA